MNPEAQKILDAILKKDLHELTDNDIRFLKARRDYLTTEQIDKYFGQAQQLEQTVQTTTETPNLLSQFTFMELRQKCKAMGIKIQNTMKRKELEALLMDNTSYYP